MHCVYTPASVLLFLFTWGYFISLFVHPCVSFYCSYSHGRFLFRCLYTPASVFTVLIHMGLFYFAVCTPLHQFLLFLFTWAYFFSLFVHPCISFHCFLFTCTYFSALFVHPRASVSAVSLFTCTYLIFCSHSQYESESRYCRQATRYISVAATLFATCQALD